MSVRMENGRRPTARTDSSLSRKAIWVTILILLASGRSLEVQGALLTEEPFGLLLSTELEKNISPHHVSGDLIQNLGVIPRFRVNDSALPWTLKLALGMGVSLTHRFQVFLYDPQIRIEKAFSIQPERFELQTGLWIYAPLSQVSRDEDMYGSGKLFGIFQWKPVNTQTTVFGELNLRGWFSRFKTRSYQSQHPQVRSAIHEIPVRLKDDFLNDLLSGGLKFGSHALLWMWSENEGVWIHGEAGWGYVLTHDDPGASLSSKPYSILSALLNVSMSLTQDITVDATYLIMGRLSGPKRFHPTGKGAAFFLGMNVEI